MPWTAMYVLKCDKPGCSHSLTVTGVRSFGEAWYSKAKDAGWHHINAEQLGCPDHTAADVLGKKPKKAKAPKGGRSAPKKVAKPFKVKEHSKSTAPAAVEGFGGE